ncbi:stachyose synthase [Olea europaea subsp. europaea]|uniref:Stachyose synthase n=1 Tax=Olea europaea subsp. europaea TaxID=158383 RepID=A0A8S0U8A6_OLEEU|nr:stachyose synthase [Olea europaea subsp. europaea]
MPGTTHLDTKIVSCKLSPGLDGTMEDFAVVKIVKGSIGLVHPDQAEEFYDSMHSYISFSMTYVMADSQLCNDVIGDSKPCLFNSLETNFNGTGLISSMLQRNDFFLLGAQQISMGRVVYATRMGYFSIGPSVREISAASRAICRRPVYVSDSLGGHDFDLLKKVVFPDGNISECVHFVLPIRECLFKSPLFDSKTILRNWSFNKDGGVVGAFNCQGGG